MTTLTTPATATARPSRSTTNPSTASELTKELLAVPKRMRLPYLRDAAPEVLARPHPGRFRAATPLFGRNSARLLLMRFCVATTAAAFAGDARGRESITLATNLPTAGTSILVLLALSSHRARDYATQGRQVPKRIAGRVGEHAAF